MQSPDDRSKTLSIRSFEGKDKPHWDRYVETSPAGTFFHLSGWREVIAEVFGHQAEYLAAWEDEQIVGILPLVHLRSRLFGNALASTPFCVYGGALADREDIGLALEREAENIAVERQVDYLELRNRRRTNARWPEKDLYVTFRKEISADNDENMKSIPRKQRAMVRKGIKAGLSSQIDEGIDDFFYCYATSVRNLGTPVFPKKYFERLKQTFTNACRVLVVQKDGRPVSAVMNFKFKDEILPYYGGGISEARQLAANDFMYWEVMRRAAEEGIRTFDYGRSKKGTGSYSFKKNWGFEPEPLHYQFRLVKANAVPDVNPLNPKYQLFINMWRKLPLPVANFVGPFLARSLG